MNPIPLLLAEGCGALLALALYLAHVARTDRQ